MYVQGFQVRTCISFNGGRDSLGSSRTHRFFSMIAAGVVWHPKLQLCPGCALPLFALVRVFGTRAKLVFSPYLIPRRRLAAGGSRANFAYVPVRVYNKVCFNLLKNPNVLQFVRRADDFFKFVRK